MLHFTFLGTSSGVPTVTRNVSALAIRNSKNKDWILIDAGEATQHRIQQAKLYGAIYPKESGYRAINSNGSTQKR